ncbi:MAG: ATP-grasp domain-containing protein, partial [Quisquiliibacterium sp.]
DQLAAQARQAAGQIAQAMNYVGVLCVEFFVLSDGALVVNEIAPRPHNSGHYTIDACVSSQFEQQARVMAGLPLGSVRQHEPSVMINLLGDIWFRGADPEQPVEPDWTIVLRHPQARLHLYGKSQARHGRKMGHVTVLGQTVDDALREALQIERALGITG